MSTQLQGLDWGQWIPLSGASRNPNVPRGPGLYRVRVAGDQVAVYVGQTGRSLRERLGSLGGAFADVMPYRDPHTAAPGLWALRHRDGCDFEVSTCSVEGDKAFRLGQEALAISLHRQAHGGSPLLNFGGMPAGYRISSANNADLARAGRRFRGGPDSAVSVVTSAPPKGRLEGGTASQVWVGLVWSNWDDASSALPPVSGVYRLRQPGHEQLVYVGQGALAARVESHRAKSRAPSHRQAALFSDPIEVSFSPLDRTPTRHLLEIENDLIAAHVLTYGRPPEAQFLG